MEGEVRPECALFASWPGEKTRTGESAESSDDHGVEIAIEEGLGRPENGTRSDDATPPGASSVNGLSS